MLVLALTFLVELRQYMQLNRQMTAIETKGNNHTHS